MVARSHHRRWSIVLLAMALGGLALPAAAQEAPPPAVAASAEAPDQQPADPAVPRHQFKSLFFTPEEIADMRYAVNIYKKNAGGRTQEEDFDEEDFLNRLTGLRAKPTEANRYYRYPQYFLESLVYHAPDNWIIWVNGQKITDKTPGGNADLRVLDIDKDKVTLQWKPISMDKVNEVWELGSNPGVDVNRRRGTVTFTLRPNQTFSSYVMNVLEGKVQPVTIDTHNIQLPDEPEDPQEEENPADASAAEEEADDDSGKGLGGLLGAYRRLGQDKPSQESKPAP